MSLSVEPKYCPEKSPFQHTQYAPCLRIRDLISSEAGQQNKENLQRFENLQIFSANFVILLFISTTSIWIERL